MCQRASNKFANIFQEEPIHFLDPRNSLMNTFLHLEFSWSGCALDGSCAHSEVDRIRKLKL